MARRDRRRADQTLLTALACGATVENAARKADLGERTVYRRLADPAFRAQLDRLRAEMVQRTAGMLTGAGMGSVKTLVELQQDASVPPTVRRGAARDVLQLSVKFREVADLEQRIAALEQCLAKEPQETRNRSPETVIPLMGGPLLKGHRT
jgi:hypothetical protein